ncbi:MAG: M15 family metallopeptidase, partial [Patescibacteria group bacterium]
RKEWKNIPILEIVTALPKKLEVIPNRPLPNKVMAWPAYYKTVKYGNENSEELKGFGELAQAVEGQIQSSPLVKVRPEVKSRLDTAQQILDSNPETNNLQLVIVDGYRQIDVQKKLFDAYLTFIREKNKHLNLNEEEILIMARKMVSEAPTDLEVLRESPPPHSTGGSTDVILVDKSKIDITSDHWLQGAMVEFGAKFDEMFGDYFHSETFFYERMLVENKRLDKNEQAALENRRVLYYVMSEVGFSNYYTEFWHYDFGNQFNAQILGKQSAEFGFAGGLANGKIVEDLSAEQAVYQAYVKKHGPDVAEKVKHHFGL